MVDLSNIAKDCMEKLGDEWADTVKEAQVSMYALAVSSDLGVGKVIATTIMPFLMAAEKLGIDIEKELVEFAEAIK